jgi:hypothetical protein
VKSSYNTVCDSIFFASSRDLQFCNNLKLDLHVIMFSAVSICRQMTQHFSSETATKKFNTERLLCLCYQLGFATCAMLQ